MSQLVPAGGELYAYVFANPAAGLDRAAWWNLALRFASLRYAEMDLDPGASMDWIRCEHDWRDFKGVAIDVDTPGVEASVYAGWHEPPGAFAAKCTDRDGTRFRIQAALRHVDLQSLNDESADSDLTIIYEGWVNFTGLIVSVCETAPAIHDVSSARHAAREFVRLDLFEEPVERSANGHCQWVFAPRTDL